MNDGNGNVPADKDARPASGRIEEVGYLEKVAARVNVPGKVRHPYHKKDVKLGDIYLARVGNKICRVRVDEVLHKTVRSRFSGVVKQRESGWSCTNLNTGRKVRIRSAAKFRGKVS